MLRISVLSRFAPLLLVLLWAAPPAAAAPGYELLWSDEFEGSAVNTAHWTFAIGDGCPGLCGWGNNELQYYRSQNAVVSGGLLTITAKQESFGGKNYTSARIHSRNKVDFTYGRVEMRAKLPIGQGLWPAFWLLPTDGAYGGWAASGEIDIMEYLGHLSNRVSGTIHYGAPFPDNVYSSRNHTLASGNFHDTFHVFALEWEPGELRWYVDDVLYACQNDWYSSGGEYPAPFDQDFYILLNCAVGGNLPGPPDGSTVFPQDYVIDYVRVYQKPEFAGCSIVFAGLDHGNPFGNSWFTYNGIGGGGIGGNTASLPPVDGCVASLSVGWGSGGTPGFFGGFGRRNPHDLTGLTHFSFWIDPDPGQDYQIVVQLQDDDDGNDDIPASPNGADDEFQTVVTVNGDGGDVLAGGGWQRVTLPLSGLADDNSYHWGGNGVFDPYPAAAGGNGQLINVVWSLVSNTGGNITFRTDRWEFTREQGSVEGVVWSDTDGDGIRGGGEPGEPGVPVELRDDRMELVDATLTDGLGAFGFHALPAGEYEVRVTTTGTGLDGADPTADPDGVQTPGAAWLAADCDAALAGRDFGYEPSSVGLPGDDAARRWVLEAAVPNPFSAGTRVTFSLAGPGLVSLAVVDVAGRVVRELVAAALPAGRHVAAWDGRDAGGLPAPGGLYFAVLSVDGTRVAAGRLLRLP